MWAVGRQGRFHLPCEAQPPGPLSLSPRRGWAGGCGWRQTGGCPRPTARELFSSALPPARACRRHLPRRTALHLLHPLHLLHLHLHPLPPPPLSAPPPPRAPCASRRTSASRRRRTWPATRNSKEDRRRTRSEDATLRLCEPARCAALGADRFGGGAVKSLRDNVSAAILHQLDRGFS
jgi:hypothetical protein